MENELLDLLNYLKEKIENIESILMEKAIKFRGDLTDVKGAAKITGLCISRIYFLTSKKKIPHYKKGKHLYFSKKELNKWKESLRKVKVKDMQIDEEEINPESEMD